MYRVAISFGALGLASGCWAQQLELSVRFSVDGGATWSRDAEVSRGQFAMGAIFMSGDIEGLWGLAGAEFRLTSTAARPENILRFAEGTSTGRVGPFDFGARTNAIYTTANGFRIDAAGDEADSEGVGMSFFQRDPNSGGGGFSRANPALCFAFEIYLGFEDQRLEFTIDQLSGGTAGYYSSSSATRRSLASARLLSGSISTPIPSPAGLAVLAIGGVLAGRVRRAGGRR